LYDASSAKIKAMIEEERKLGSNGKSRSSNWCYGFFLQDKY
jgi:hypothetical protein